MLAVLRDGPLDRQALERRLGVSWATTHWMTMAIGECGTLERIYDTPVSREHVEKLMVDR